MIIKKAELETVCGVTSRFPDHDQPEIAFAGKSNVGKSSLINALMNRKSLARTSGQPGKTQTINFYHINDAIYLVDLPGYGYARANEEVKAQWGRMIERYLKNAPMLKCVFLLVDIRHEASENDRLMYQWILSNGYHPVIIATKVDKLKRSQVAKQVRLVRESIGLEKDGLLFPFSAQTKQGRDDIWQYVENLLADSGETDR
ncbi:MAG: ribosome biogenesis GTP-binding protein YihA/YsxC [Clostridiales bacterium]|nr:ribosome biogenesis GTP-binding protein YihA/YsxC [Clostridiales bacterium]